MLKKKLLVLLLSASMAMTMLAGCDGKTDAGVIRIRKMTQKQKLPKMMRQKQRLTAKMRRSLSWKMELIR